MSNISLGQYLHDSPKLNNEKPVNEVLLTLIAASVLAYTCQPLLNTEFMKSIGGGLGMMFGGIGSMFGFGKNKDKEKDGKDDKDKEKSNKSKSKEKDSDDDDAKKTNDMMQNMFAFCQKHIDKEKDENKKKSLSAMLDTYRASTVDDDGNPVPLDKMAERFEQVTGKKPEDWAKENDIEMPSKGDIEKINKAANDEIGKMSPEERKKVADEGRAKAKASCAEIKKHREEIDVMQKELDDLKKKVKETDDPDKRKDLNQQIEDQSKKVTTAMKETPGVYSQNDIETVESSTETTDEKPENKPEETPEGDGANKDGNQGENSNNDPKPEEKPKNKKKEPKKDDSDKDTNAKKAARLKQVEDKWTKASEEAEELEKKIKDASGEEKEKLEKELDKKKKLIANLEQAQKKLDDNSEKEYKIHHDGKEDTLIKRAKKRGEGSVWCYKSDPDTTVSADQAREMLKKNGIKEKLSLTEWLEIFCD